MYVSTEKLKVKPELVGEFPVQHKTDVHSVLMNDIGNVRTPLGNTWLLLVNQ